MKFRTFPFLWLLLAFSPVVSFAHQPPPTVFVTADNLNGTNLFGTLDLRTGEFTEIAQTTPLFYALSVGPDGRLFGADLTTGMLFTISKSGATSPYGTVISPANQFSGYGYFGLAYPGWGDRFLAVNVDPQHVSLYSIGRHGTKQTDLGVIEGPNTGIYFSGSLALGPRDKLYFDFVPTGASGAQLYTVNDATGAPTPVGKGTGTDYLALVSDGEILYGIDGDTTTNIGIYVIDRMTGIAKATGVVVHGLPSTEDFYIDTAAFDSHCR